MWIYDNADGRIYRPDRTLAGHGYAGGNGGKHPEGINNPDMQYEKGIGPLPVAIYDMTEVIEHSHLGPFAIKLEPRPSSDMQGRGGFFCHGDTTPSGNASDGCIIMPRVVREEMWASDDHAIQVITHFNG